MCVYLSLSLSLFSQGHHLVIANVGDSRAILATKDENEVLKAIQLTVDLKPNLPSKQSHSQVHLLLS
jgi:serine/threonine protein phosphatase PrpC